MFIIYMQIITNFTVLGTIFENNNLHISNRQSKIPLDWSEVYTSNQFKVILSRTGWKYILPTSPRFNFLKISGTGWKYILPTSPRFYLLKLSGTGRKYILPTSTRFNFLKISGTGWKYILPTSPRFYFIKLSGTGR